jgi:hypothetical protein
MVVGTTAKVFKPMSASLSVSGTLSPFRISRDDEEELDSNKPFATVREYLAKERNLK